MTDQPTTESANNELSLEQLLSFYDAIKSFLCNPVDTGDEKRQALAMQRFDKEMLDLAERVEKDIAAAIDPTPREES